MPYPYRIIRSLDAQLRRQISDALNELALLIGGSVSDDSFSPSWNGSTDVAPSQNAVYDKVELVAADVALLGAYRPAMMQFDGTSSHYHSLYTSAGNKVTITAHFKLSQQTGGGSRVLVSSYGTSQPRLQIRIATADNATVDNRSRLFAFAPNSAGTAIMRLYSDAVMDDDVHHTVHAEFDGDAGTGVLTIDGVTHDAVVTNRVAPTTGTLSSGANSIFTVASNQSGADLCKGDIGYVGMAETSSTDGTNFTLASGQPVEENTNSWTLWGSQPLFFNHIGQMTNNQGSAGNMTANGIIRLWVTNSYNSMGIEPMDFGNWVTITKGTTQDVTNAGVTNDSELTFTVLASRHYLVEMDLVISGNDTTGDYTADFAVSSGTMTGKGTCQNLTAAAAVQNIIITAAAAANTTAIVTGAPTASLDDLVAVRMFYAFTASANATFRYRFGNSAASPGRTSRTWKGSMMRWKVLD